MGISNKFVNPFYKRNISNVKSPVAILGSINNDMFDGDLYDLQLGNWEINSEWKLNKEYSTIICTRCAYFSNDPKNFMKLCYKHLVKGGLVYVDWGLGDHWNFPEFHVGWKVESCHEYAYRGDNYLWSSLWDSKFLEDREVQKFSEEIKKRGYNSLENAIHKEVPKILNPNELTDMFDWKIDFFSISSPRIQLYVLFSGVKK